MRESLAPEELEQASFSVVLRGYDRDEVDAYLKNVVDELRETQRLRSERLYETLGEEMGGLLQHARDSADDMIAQAQSEAASLREEARRAAGATRSDAKVEAKDLLDRARADAQQTRAEADKAAQARVDEAARRVAELEQSEAEARERVSGLRLQLVALTDQLEQLGTPPEAADSADKAEMQAVDESADTEERTIDLTSDARTTSA
jgi:DivIVA domain-containing protein